MNSRETAAIAPQLPASMRFFERDWLSSNNTLFFDEAGATLVDSGFIKHAPMTEALVHHELTARGGVPLLRIINTHLHSDHCGGNARLTRVFGCRVRIPEGNAQHVATWQDEQMHHGQCGHRVERFDAHEVARAGDEIELGGQRWRFLATPGHDPDSLLLHNAEQRLLISADALWEDGFGLIFGALGGDTSGFDDQEAVLELIESLDVDIVLPGHGRIFSDFQGALSRARQRLAYQRADLVRHARYGLKVLLKYQMMDEERVNADDLIARMSRTLPARQGGQTMGVSAEAAITRGIEDLLAQRALARDGDDLVNR